MSSSRRRPAPPPARWALEDLAGSFDGGHLVPLPDEGVGPDLAAIEEAAYQRGYHDGQLAGVQAEAARLRGALAAVDEALLSLQGEAEAWVGNARENLCALAIAVARQVLSDHVVIDPATVTALVDRALAEIPVEQPVIVRLHPDDLAALQQLAAGDDAATPRPRDRAEVQWVADPRVARGGCLLESRDRIIDGRIDSALERLYRRLSATDA